MDSISIMALGMLLLSPAPRDLAAFYEARCAVCHGSDGTGRSAEVGRLGPRSFTAPGAFGKASDDDLVRTVREGTGAMPAFRDLLDEAEAKRLVQQVVRPMAARKHR